MKRIVFAARVALLALLMSVSGLALADKKCTDPTVQCVDTIVVGSGGGGGGSYGGGGGSFGGSGNGGCTGNCSGGNNGSGSNTLSDATIEKLKQTIKASKDYCKPSDEDCGHWGSRMVAPKGIPIPGGGVGSGYCPNISTLLPIVGQAECNKQVSYEVNVNGCGNVGCP
jgi:hypothetical protein